MKNLFHIILLILTPSSICAQIQNTDSGRHLPAKEVFESYKKTEYQKFSKSEIVIEKNKVIFNSIKSIEFSDNTDEKTKLILINGLLDTYFINKIYHLKINRIDELKVLNPNLQTRRFKFYISYVGNKNPLFNSANPHEYYFELYNKNADENTTFVNFLNSAKLTFLKDGGIIL